MLLAKPESTGSDQFHPLQPPTSNPLLCWMDQLDLTSSGFLPTSPCCRLLARVFQIGPVDVPSLPSKKIDTSKTLPSRLPLRILGHRSPSVRWGGGVRMSETRIALRRSSDEDSVSLATRLKTSYRLFDTYRVIRTFFSSVDLIYRSN